MFRETWRREERRETGRSRHDTEESGRYYQMKWRGSCGQHLTPDKVEERERERV